MNERLRYVTVRRNAKGKLRWYWQRPHHRLTRLPDDPVERFALVKRLNNAADAVIPVELERDTIGWVIERYRSGNEYRRLSAASIKAYKRFLRDIENLGRTLPFTSFTRRAVVDFVDSYPKTHQRRTVATVLKNLFAVARYHGIVSNNEATALRLEMSRPRDRIWTDDEVARWIETASIEDPHMRTAFLLLQYTAQRPLDVLKITWPQYSGSAIRLRQQKTKALLDVPVHPVLRDHLDGLARSGLSLTIVAFHGRPVSYALFNRRFRRIAQRAGIEGAQARDLRRTAMLRCAEAGATVPMIASVSGHSIEATQRILETYLPRNFALAEIAITKLTEYKQRKESNALDKNRPLNH
jgi:integrase